MRFMELLFLTVLAIPIVQAPAWTFWFTIPLWLIAAGAMIALSVLRGDGPQS